MAYPVPLSLRNSGYLPVRLSVHRERPTSWEQRCSYCAYVCVGGGGCACVCVWGGGVLVCVCVCVCVCVHVWGGGCINPAYYYNAIILHTILQVI